MPREHPVAPTASQPPPGTRFALETSSIFNAAARKAGPDSACQEPPSALDAFAPPPVAWESYSPGAAVTYQGPVALGDSLVLAGTSTVLVQFDRRTGAPAWETEKWYGQAPDNHLIASGRDGLLYLFDPDLVAGDLRRHELVRWRVNSGVVQFTVPPVVLPNGSVITRDYFGAVVRLDPKPGSHSYEVVWHTDEPGGTVDGEHMLYDPARQLLYIGVSGSDASSRATVALDVRTGREAWRTPGLGLQLAFSGASRLLRWAVVGCCDVAVTHQAQLLDRDSGAVLDTYAPADKVAANGTGDRIYVSWWPYDSAGKPLGQTTLTALDDHLRPLWSWTTPKAAVPFDAATGYDSTIATRPVVGDDGSVYLTTHDCHVYALDRDGNVMWADHHPYPFDRTQSLLYRGYLYTVSTFTHLTNGLIPVSFIRAYRVAPSATSGPLGP